MEKIHLFMCIVCVAVAMSARPAAAGECPGFMDHEFRKLHSAKTVNLCEEFAGRPMLIVNNASHCGYTPQFKGLEALHQAYQDKGLVVVGVPSNDFRQAARNEEKAAEVCYTNYGVTFTMTQTVPVKGRDAHPLFAELARQAGEPRWNFNKYLVDADGKVVHHFDSRVTPDADELRRAIDRVL